MQRESSDNSVKALMGKALQKAEMEGDAIVEKYPQKKVAPDEKFFREAAEKLIK